MSTSEQWGWAGSVESFLALPRERWRRSLELHYEQLLGFSPGRTVGAGGKARELARECDLGVGARA